jgi:serine/threonine protein kinase
MSPENIAHQKYSTKSDVWAFGITCIEILERKLPFSEYTDLLTLALDIRDKGRHPTLPPNCPDWLGTLLVEYVWVTDPSKRLDMDVILECLMAASVEPARASGESAFAPPGDKKAKWRTSIAPRELRNTVSKADMDHAYVEFGSDTVPPRKPKKKKTKKDLKDA